MNFSATERLVETYSVLDNLTSTERDRLRKCEVALEVSLGVIYGDRLATIMVEALIDELDLDPRVFRYVISGDVSEIDPGDRDAFRKLSRELVEANDLAVRNLEFSDAARKTELASEYLELLKPAQRRIDVPELVIIARALDVPAEHFFDAVIKAVPPGERI